MAYNNDYQGVPRASSQNSDSNGNSVAQNVSQSAINQQSNSSQQRAGRNDSFSSNGDKEISKITGEEKGDLEKSVEKKAKKKGTEKAVEVGKDKAKDIAKSGKEAASKGGKAATKSGGKGLKGFMNGLKQSGTKMMEAAKVPAAAGKAIGGGFLSVIAGVVAAVVGSVSGVSSISEPVNIYEIAYVNKAAIGATNVDVSEDDLQREIARHIWTTLSGFKVMEDPDGETYPNSTIVKKIAYGLRPEQVCAVLGNFEHESGLDPTAVETIMTEPFTLGQYKQDADANDFVASVLRTMDGAGMSAAERKAYFASHPTIHRVGVGLAQWTDTVPVGTSWSVQNPGRNMKLMTYAKLMGMQYYLNSSSPGWNSEDWVVGNTQTESKWYDLKVQLAYMLDKSSVGDAKAQWLWDWSELGEDLWDGDILAKLDSSTLQDTIFEGWTMEFTIDEGWIPSTGKVEDNIVSVPTTLRPVGDNDSGKVASGDLDDSGDAYYSTTDSLHTANVKYEKWDPYDGAHPIGSTNWMYPQSTPANYVTKSGADAGRDLAFEYAEKTAAAMYHGHEGTTGNISTEWNWLSTIAGNDFIATNDPREYTMDNVFHKYLTAEEAEARKEPTLRTGWSWTCSIPEHDHSSGCNSEGCTHECTTSSCWHPTCGHGYCTGCGYVPACTHSCSEACGETCTHSCGGNCGWVPSSSCQHYCNNDCSSYYSCTHSHTSACCTLYHKHENSSAGSGDEYVAGTGCAWKWNYRAGYIKLGDPAATANGIAIGQFYETFKYFYRYHLYRYLTLYYTADFLADYEGITTTSLPQRSHNATKWFNMWWNEGDDDYADGAEPNLDSPKDTTYHTSPAGNFNDYFFKIESAYAQGIMQIIDRTRDSLRWYERYYKIYDHDVRMADVSNRNGFVSNKMIAQCAVMLAHPQKSLSVSNNGTKCYQQIHDLVMKGDTIYQSCDRTVCTAVRWSGVDDNFPGGNTTVIEQYLLSSPRWTQLDWGGDIGQLQAGDILIRKDSLAPGSDYEEPGDAHHIFIYVGNYMAQMYCKVWQDYEGYTDAQVTIADNIDIVHGSYGERSPALDSLEANSSFRSYVAFRCTAPQAPDTSKYASYEFSPLWSFFH